VVRRPLFASHPAFFHKKETVSKSKGSKRVSIKCFELEAVFCSEGTPNEKNIPSFLFFTIT
jgi:hypothetical protein